MKYLPALLIGIGLLAHNPAFAEALYFGPFNNAPMEECVVAADEGLKLEGELADTYSAEQRFLVWAMPKGIPMDTPWRVYEIHMSLGGGEFRLKCIYREFISRTT